MRTVRRLAINPELRVTSLEISVAEGTGPVPGLHLHPLPARLLWKITRAMFIVRALASFWQ
jgi:hypothetical protein